MITAPDWLSTREGSLKPGLMPHILFVVFNGRPMYRLDVRPAKGGFTCDVTQTVNGHRLDSGNTLPNETAAFTDGLDTLRNKLGW